MVPVKFPKPDMVCRVNTMDWPLTFNVISEGPDVLNALRSEDMGGVKLPDPEADDVGGGVMLGIDGEDVLDRDSATEMLNVFVVAIEVPAISVVVGTLLATSLVIWKVEIDNDEKGEPLVLDSSRELLEL